MLKNIEISKNNTSIIINNEFLSKEKSYFLCNSAFSDNKKIQKRKKLNTKINQTDIGEYKFKTLFKKIQKKFTQQIG